MPPAKVPPDPLTKSMDRLTGTIEQIPREYDLFFQPGRHLLFTYVKGIVSGLGALTAVAIVVPLLLSMLKEVQWVPLVGDFVARVSVRMEQVRPK
ncbi:MAG: hypothetical protein Greene041619_1044 [Candidatus Peregrinibacteria bacterium Greene0416_19]|nr:MAG: hypothetical protein Greene041619_1044 [Candidatus Peregrinibacteria bacterium Greene0416_19]